MSALPSGTVTLLFTDIEGSTGLVRALGEGWGEVLEAERRLLRSAVEVHGGREIDARADELFAAFGCAADGVAAAVAAQRALLAHGWPAPGGVRVRMGIHTGEPAIRQDSYLGIDVHRAARLCLAGHGGQILLSATTRALLADGEPPGTSFSDLGAHELRGLGEERIFQLLAPGLPQGFPALRVSDGGPERPFAGRESELGAAARAAVGEDGQRNELPRVVLADDSVLLREGLARLLEDAGFRIVGQSGTASDLLLKVRSYSPDVAIVDIRMPPTHTDEGLRAAQEIREKHPNVGVLVLSQYVEPAYALELLAESAEGVGYLLKDRVSDVGEFAAAVRRVADGGSALDPAIVSQLVGRRRRHDPLDELTPREREVLEQMAEGRSNQAIAERLFVTPRAVEKHVTSIFTKLRLPVSAEDHRRVLAVLAFLRG